MAGKSPWRLTRHQHRVVTDAVAAAEERTGLQFCVYLGPTEDDARAHAERMFVDAGLHSRPAVLLLVAPPERRVEIVTAEAARARVSDEACRHAITGMADHFRIGRFAAGIAVGLSQLADAAGPGTAEPGEPGEQMPDLIEE